MPDWFEVVLNLLETTKFYIVFGFFIAVLAEKFTNLQANHRFSELVIRKITETLRPWVRAANWPKNKTNIHLTVATVTSVAILTIIAEIVFLPLTGLIFLGITMATGKVMDPTFSLLSILSLILLTSTSLIHYSITDTNQRSRHT